jgi:Protein of unknown function (DUF2971)
VAENEQLQEIVYHYTSLDAMMNIVKTRTLWATSIAYLNDVMERQLLIRAAKNRLPILARRNVVPETLAFPKMEAIEADISSIESQPFITSFASNPDSLMHWRSYCPQENGVAIGFRTKCLSGARIDQSSAPGMIVSPLYFGAVRYIEPTADKEVDDAIQAAYKNATFYLLKNPQTASYWGLNELFTNFLEDEACLFKHQSFLVEKEYRLVLGDVRYRSDAMKFRSTRSSLVPYVPLRIPSLMEVDPPATPNDSPRATWDSITSVTVGPTANMPLSVAAVRVFFQSLSLEVEVRESRVPYRDW